MTILESDAFVFFGATGDLAYKKTFPALYAMVRSGLDIPIIGMARAGWTLDKLKKRFLTLAANDVIKIRCFKRLLRKQGWMPSPQNDREVRVPCLDGLCDIDRFPDHRPRHQRYAKAKSVTHFGEHALLKIRSNGGVDQHNLEPRPDERSGNGEYSQWRRSLRARKRRKEEDNFSRFSQNKPLRL